MAKDKTSRLPGFYNLPLAKRVTRIAEYAALTHEEQQLLGGAMGLSIEQASHMIENVVGLYALPMGIATNFKVNERDVLVPMVIEEPSVVAGAALAAKLARAGGGFFATTDDPIMIGQIQVINLKQPWAARLDVVAQKQALLDAIKEIDPILTRLGGGPRDLKVRVLETTPTGPMLVIHLHYDVRDAMGANAVNSACERLAPMIEQITGGTVLLRILSNLADQRLARVRVTIPETALAFGDFSGEAVAQGIEHAWAFAAADPYRATTHNKGIMNGIDAVVLATGNDWRAIEAGAHAYAARDGVYTSLSRWQRDHRGNLIGALELPLALGTVGGATRVQPLAKMALKIMGIQSAQELAEVVVAVGLAQNFAALRALATEGIQRGHMTLHARQVAMAAGAVGEEITTIAGMMVQEGAIRSDRATTLLSELQTKEGE
ncbi:MAG: hydroxymethylglutaryl-CoA reductase, degradative [Anaerolineae bacterium]|nr:hydroxymethylglutaryl-CoA reductase, degradative [Anaerolineae bacterium]